MISPHFGMFAKKYALLMMETKIQHHNPSLDRLSVIAATILIAYTIARLVNIPPKVFEIQLPGLFISIQINIQTIVAFLVAGITASGTDRLIKDHPQLGDKSTLSHWLLPAMTALAIGIPFYQIPLSIFWWIGFVIGGSLLIIVMIAEYFVVDPNDVYYAPASIILTAISFAIFMVFTASLRFSDTRLLFLLPAVSFTAGLVSLRTLNLRLSGKWPFSSAFVVMLIIGQLTAAIHYWPISPVGFALILLGVSYALTSFFENLYQGESIRKASLDPLFVLVLILVAAIWVW